MNKEKERSLKAKGLNDVLTYFKSREDFAHALGISRQAVYKWCRNGCIPAARIADVRKITGIPAYYIRPDLFEEFD